MDCCLSAVQLDGTWRPMYGILRAVAGIPYMGWSARNFTKEVHMGLFQCLNKNVTRSSRLSYGPVWPIALLFFGSAEYSCPAVGRHLEGKVHCCQRSAS